MKKLAIPLTLLAAAVLPACTTYDRVPSAQTTTTIAPQAMAYRPGTGVIERIVVAPSAVAGSSAAPSASTTGMKRLIVRMDDGTVQFIDTDSPEVRTGMRIELTPDHFIHVLQ